MHTFLTNINSEVGKRNCSPESVRSCKKKQQRVAAIVFCMTVSVSHMVAEVFWPTPGLVH